ncbi:succinate dehydrogenase assembly factor 2 [Pontixanthobacter aestiaquae]|uniref:FAD assembly factor SdhE n=1 Tax=Pontixanthobacter aestiaquae TaxID=1509367 RepID=A0A844ZC57_9SPHN|nr:succinate dehydrogenase assembly factor 2 [Pontixanthobacter aestiaquae]MDN3645594.1 succinate dehydrogenase assembly factor 2 [Pontixanthobacter aestiaquae]MXO83409.1 succinate dehydrogenase assembly factor 2 [Pontixanthobacter aestiaquae]
MPDASDLTARFARAKFRSWHRGTREADYMIGGFYDRYHGDWSEADLAWFESLLDEDDVDIMAWALKTQPAPESFLGTHMDLMQKLDYVDIPR